MKTLILMFSLLTIGSSSAWADNLLPYIEMPIESTNLLAFSSQGVTYKACDDCATTKLTASTNVEYFEHNNPIDLKKATELFVEKKHSFVSIFYDRNSNIYGQVVFGGYPELDTTHQPITNSQGE